MRSARYPTALVIAMNGKWQAAGLRFFAEYGPASGEYLFWVTIWTTDFSPGPSEVKLPNPSGIYDSQGDLQSRCQVRRTCRLIVGDWGKSSEKARGVSV